ncbi:diphosphomevalonate decarboxylase [Nitzschia inconspicua]|uniref:Diphosphomevalonate decarboxylase n=1 Tax=Nitzschia inconspicua TaxID=303405 RepID=A0A9K3LLZ5_9STRA|nr:diphosphomevalonate decarboxylase [Nitzschia inconspicua]
MTSSPIYIATVSAPTNIACIKYWGKADAHYNTPTNDSVSVTLDQADLKAVTTVAASASFTNDRLWLNGVEEDVSQNKRFRACIDGVKALAKEPERWKDLFVHVSSYNTFPTAAGLASSAAGYAALVAALAELMDAQEEYVGQLSTIARQGSGSACRSLYGGFVAWKQGTAAGNKSPWDNSMAVQIATEQHWPEIRALILVVSDAKKDTSSTAGMSTSVATSTLLQHRIKSVVPERMEAIEKAFLAKDFEAFGQLTMKDSNSFHAVCMDTYPPIFYMNDISRMVVRIVHAYNAWAGDIRAAYTFDAGPNAVLYTLEQYAVEIGALMLHYFPADSENYINRSDYANEVAAFELDSALLAATDKTGRSPTAGDVKRMYYTQSGPGPQVLDMDQANLDPTTGLNTYAP